MSFKSKLGSCLFIYGRNLTVQRTMDGGNERERLPPPQSPPTNQQQKFLIKIPSYEEVIESSQSKSAPVSLFEPSTSFTQAFSFVKNSDFYRPPPPPPPSQPSSSAQFHVPPRSSLLDFCSLSYLCLMSFCFSYSINHYIEVNWSLLLWFF